ncbi:cell wall hydrolase [Candidatus Planktophila dulcis]|jgi:cell wall-associated NlpC family hydrolase|uniref:C40 family peptidase n=1 Tax=Candidatus Planktophila dulcis TaxID=1884914 RepID=UPI000BACCCC5|nr:C40 family peptidase [Candidatus Planktophila dulcis]ASY15093.1 cell wall hydrolase [Candidatus Planktophila dulcis]ASY21769.1 cell wall hydrolase [Candidatus Planktophila dulcis]
MRRRKSLMCLAIIASLTLAATPAIAKPKPTLAEIEAAKQAEAAKKAAADAAAKKLAAANLTLKQLTARANAAQAVYLKAKRELEVATAQAIAAAKHAAETAAAVAEAHRVIGKLAANAYILGGSMSDIQPLLSSNGPQDLIDQLSTLNTLGAQNTTALDRYKAAEIVAKAAKKKADEAKAIQVVATAKVEATKKIADAAQALQQKEVNKLRAVQDKLMKELATARNVRVTLEQQRQLALLEESQASTAATTINQAKVWPNIGFKGRTTIRTTEAQRLAAVAFAKKQVQARKPYIWGSEGPNSFDCSGLVYAAYKSAGLGWPNWDRLNSALYSGYTKHVALTELQPGDLLFYSYKGTISTIHHITIYAGGGMMWEANSKDKGLLYSSIYSVKGLMPFGGRV